MKTLRNTLVIVLIAASLGLVNVFAQKKVVKSKAQMVEAQMPTVNLKFEKESNEALRVVITDVLNNSLIYESGKVNIVFKVSEDKHIEILNVFGTNPALVSSVKYQMGRTIIMVPEALEGTYMIPVLF